MATNMKLLSITILKLRTGADRVYLKTDLPEAMYPFREPLDLEFRAAKGQAEEYCKQHFPGVPIKEII